MARYSFRWIDWNLDHATKHGVSVEECERLVCRGPARQIGDDRLRVVGRGKGGRWIQVIYAFEEDGDVFVIHARPLTESEKQRYR